MAANIAKIIVIKPVLFRGGGAGQNVPRPVMLSWAGATMPIVDPIQIAAMIGRALMDHFVFGENVDFDQRY